MISGICYKNYTIVCSHSLLGQNNLNNIVILHDMHVGDLNYGNQLSNPLHLIPVGLLKVLRVCDHV